MRPWLGAELQDVTQEIADSLGFARPEGRWWSACTPIAPWPRLG